ncbi:hypothetical protein K1719_023231 [Acacia pycnantha]|nr:hypothetical protein K1719_023231 [Acacia pycnantha]
MDKMDLTPKKAEAIFEGDGGSYYLWSASHVPTLANNNVGAGRLLLQPQGFALPHYADSDKIGYVLQGNDGAIGTWNGAPKRRKRCRFEAQERR